MSEPATLKARYGKRVLHVEFANQTGPGCAEFEMDGLGENEKFFELIRTAELKTIHSQEASLDRVFADVTGVSLEAGEE